MCTRESEIEREREREGGRGKRHEDIDPMRSFDLLSAFATN